MRRIVSSRRLIIVSFALFIVLGANAGVTGVAWPSIRADFSRPLADLGTLLAIGTGGYFLAGLMAGWLTRRFGIGRVLVSVLVVGTVALIGYGVVPNWPLLVSCAVAVGFTGGTVDAVTNAYTALHHDTRTMNLLHACFGLGATGGPLLVASILARGLSWKVAYFVLAVAEAVLVITVFRVRSTVARFNRGSGCSIGWSCPPARADGARTARHVPAVCGHRDHSRTMGILAADRRQRRWRVCGGDLGGPLLGRAHRRQIAAGR